MYDVVRSVILSKRFELSDMLQKIDTLWVQGNLTDEQKTELIALARANADPALSNDLAARIEDHESRLRKLEAGSEGGGVQPSTEYPEFVEGRSYRTGDKVTFKGKRYVCTLPEHTEVCVWSPEAYPPYWQAVV